QQPGLDYLDLYQANLRILKVAADPAGASCQGCMQTDDKRQADEVRPCKHCVTPVDAASVSTGWRVATCCSWKKNCAILVAGLNRSVTMSLYEIAFAGQLVPGASLEQ